MLPGRLQKNQEQLDELKTELIELNEELKTQQSLIQSLSERTARRNDKLVAPEDEATD